MGALPKEERLFTYADYKAWELAEGERYELIYGEAYAMSAPNARHQATLMALIGQFYQYFRGKSCKVYPAPYDVRLFFAEDESDDTVVQPDIVVVCDEKKRGSEGCRGAPDFVAEILSPSNTVIEMGRKLKLYKKAGVREYWIVDPENNDIAVHRFEEGASSLNNYEATGTVEPAVFPGLVISLDEVFAP
ncbi:MAG TPA: Uma2 family endonuclease [Treponema sp.]|nr:Uma2 family endonuclease [Treponema sp.]